MCLQIRWGARQTCSRAVCCGILLKPPGAGAQFKFALSPSTTADGWCSFPATRFGTYCSLTCGGRHDELDTNRISVDTPQGGLLANPAADDSESVGGKDHPLVIGRSQGTCAPSVPPAGPTCTIHTSALTSTDGFARSQAAGGTGRQRSTTAALLLARPASLTSSRRL